MTGSDPHFFGGEHEFIARVTPSIILMLGIFFGGPVTGNAQPTDWVFTKIADTNTLIPGDTRTFVEFGAPQISNGAVSFSGSPEPTSASGFLGIYTTLGGTLRLVVDRNSLVPNMDQTFSGFEQVIDLSGRNIVFRDIGSALVFTLCLAMFCA